MGELGDGRDGADWWSQRGLGGLVFHGGNFLVVDRNEVSMLDSSCEVMFTVGFVGWSKVIGEYESGASRM